MSKCESRDDDVIAFLEAATGLLTNAATSNSTLSGAATSVKRDWLAALLPAAAAGVMGGPIAAAVAHAVSVVVRVLTSREDLKSEAIRRAFIDVSLESLEAAVQELRAGLTRLRDAAAPSDEILGGLALGQTGRESALLRFEVHKILERSAGTASALRRASLYNFRGIACQEGGVELFDEGMRSYDLAIELASAAKAVGLQATALLGRSALHRKNGDPLRAQQDLTQAQRLLEQKRSYIAGSFLLAERLKWAVKSRDRGEWLRIKSEAGKLVFGSGDEQLMALAGPVFEAQLKEALVRAAWTFGESTLPALKYRLVEVRELAGPLSVWRSITDLTEASFEIELAHGKLLAAGVERLIHQIRYAARHGHVRHRAAGEHLMDELHASRRLPEVLKHERLCRCGKPLTLIGSSQYECARCRTSIDVLKLAA